MRLARALPPTTDHKLREGSVSTVDYSRGDHGQETRSQLYKVCVCEREEDEEKEGTLFYIVRRS